MRELARLCAAPARAHKWAGYGLLSCPQPCSQDTRAPEHGDPRVLLPVIIPILWGPRAVHECGCASTQGIGQSLLLQVPGRHPHSPVLARDSLRADPPSGGGGPLRGPCSSASSRLAQSPCRAQASALALGPSSPEYLSPRLWGLCPPRPAGQGAGVCAGLAFGCKIFSEAMVPKLKRVPSRSNSPLHPIAKERS